MSHHVLDTKRLLCPMPVIKTQNRVKDLKIGDTLEIIGTDPGIMQDIPAWCRIQGHEILEIKEQDKEIFIVLRVLEKKLPF